VIEEFFAHPEKALLGEDRIMSILFSDVRKFTTIAEKMLPNQVVESLNQYFGRMVEVIEKRRGIVDKYMGDAIMAFFGAPERRGDEAFQALMSGFDMLAELKSFNQWMAERDRPPFSIGVGISYGYTTIGNIGCERKLDYTVIGDMVNIGSRIEGLTKHFGIPLLVSDSVARSVRDKVPCRLVGKVVVKGLTRDIGVFEARKDLSAREQKGWDTYSIALEAYYDRKFDEASSALQAAKQFMPDDSLSERFLERCTEYIATPPPEGWTGVEIMEEK
jgi:class 3 adenylate cyclase